MRKKLDDKIEDGFIDRWSRKKSELENSPAVVEQPAGEDNNEIKNIDKAIDDASENVILYDDDMPQVESLDESSDYSGFLSPGVSDGLRKLALRKLFNSAKFNIRDGLDDYDDDFRSFTALGDIITSDMKHQMELEEEREKQRLAQQEHVDQTEEALTKDKPESNEEEENGENPETEETSDQFAEESPNPESTS